MSSTGASHRAKIPSQAQFPVLAANVGDDASRGFESPAWLDHCEKDGVGSRHRRVTPDVPIWDGGKEGVEACTYGPTCAAVKMPSPRSRTGRRHRGLRPHWACTPSS